MKFYEKMSKREAAAALQEFLEERPRALEHLSASLAAQGERNVNLDGTVESLVPLWVWVKSVLAERMMTEPGGSEARISPSWLRYELGTEPTLSPESIAIVDGVISYLCRVVETGAPGAKWRIGHHRIRSYMWQNHPMLAHDSQEVPMAHLIPGIARGHASGRRTSDDDKLARIAAAVIEQLNGTDEETAAEDEPLIEVEDLGEDELRGREIEVSLREDLAHEYSRDVDRMAKTLAEKDGIAGVIREDREVLLVATSSWDIQQLERWIIGYLKEKLRD